METKFNFKSRVAKAILKTLEPFGLLIVVACATFLFILLPLEFGVFGGIIDMLICLGCIFSINYHENGGGIKNMELYDSKRCQDLKQRIEDTDSIKENHRLVNMYLAERIRCVERVIANEFPDDVSYQEMIECLWEDLKLAQKQIQYTYGKVLK